jgi:hypothetical protein
MLRHEKLNKNQIFNIYYLLTFKMLVIEIALKGFAAFETRTKIIEGK